MAIYFYVSIKINHSFKFIIKNIKYNCLGISIRIDGRAFCRWTEGTGDSKRTHIGEEYYLSERTFFLGDRTGE